MKFPFTIHMTDAEWHEYLMTIPEPDRADQWAKDLLKAFDKGWIDAIDSLRMLQNMLNEQGDKRAVEWIQQHKRIEKNQDMARARAYKERFGK